MVWAAAVRIAEETKSAGTRSNTLLGWWHVHAAIPALQSPVFVLVYVQLCIGHASESRHNSGLKSYSGWIQMLSYYDAGAASHTAPQRQHV